ncbi:galanin receptor type 1-like [Phycodurus eques]|uniref:galanin receptor type 1-like n=1 Tax=Phycodurus eques TaxID=693459 RepID=UPI002ACD9B81|nr:galanin receptor type 1-like [Phycodurus eques]
MEMPGHHVNSSEPAQRNREEEAVIKVLVPILDGLILVTGLVGQLLVITTLTGRKRKDHHPTHGTETLLLALSAVDLLLLLCLPFHTSAITLGFWTFGNFMCKGVSFLGVGCSSASVFTLAALAVTRYLTVVHHTWVYRSRMHRRVKGTVTLLWLPASAAPQFAFRTITTSRAVHCFAFLSDFNQLVYSINLFFFGFALPLGIIVLMYAKIYCFLRHPRLFGNAPQLERYHSQVTHASAILVLVFTLLWLPSYALMFSIVGRTIQGSKGYNTVAILARLLASSVVVVNPILYGFMSCQKFRRELLELGRERWTFCKNSMAGCPHMMLGRDMVQSFELDTSSEA